MKRILLAIAAFIASIGFAFAAVDANTATQAELDAVPGIGPALSQRIVDERKNGPFKDVSDLASRVKGIGDTNVKKMVEGRLTVGGRGGAVARPAKAEKADKPAKAEAAPKAAEPKAAKAE